MSIKTFLAIVFPVLILCSAASAAQTIWSGSTSTDWSTAGNWDAGVPDSVTEAVVNLTPANICTIDTGDDAQCERLTVRVSGTCYMTGGDLEMFGASGRWRIGWRVNDDSFMSVSGGTITTQYTLQIADDAGATGALEFSNATATIGRGIDVGDGDGGVATMTINSGTFTASSLGAYASQVGTAGVLNMNGGTLDFGSTLTIAGVAYLDGGTIKNTNLTINTGGQLDISDGVMIINGDDTADIANYAADGRITGQEGINRGWPYDGSEGYLRWDYDDVNPGKTTVWTTATKTASNPDPADEQTDVGLNADLSWMPGDSATSHDVYLGTDYNSVANADHNSPEFMGNQEPNTFDPGTLDADTTYYWAIDEVNESDPNSPWYGAVWSFTTVALPGQASNPSPDDEELNVDPNADISWTPGDWAVSHDVYFGDNFDDVNNGTGGTYKGNQTDTTYDPGPMALATNYYWRIDEVNTSHPNSPWIGDVWSFTTLTSLPIEDIPPTIWVDSNETLADEGGDRSYTSYGEWNTNDDYEGWIVSSAASSSVSGGVITATENVGGSPMTLEIPVSGGELSTNLDYGYKEKLQICCKIPAGFTGEFKFQYKTTFRNSYTDDKVFVIPAGTLIADGDWHTYILDLVLERNFRGDMRGMLLTPFDGVSPDGRTVQIDYIRLGDLLSDTIELNTDLPFYEGETLEDCNNVQSKHFALWWSPHTDVLYEAEYGPFAELYERHRYNLRCLEETYQYLYKVLGYDEPFYDTDGSTPGRFKNFVTTWHEGGWMSNYNGFVYNNYGPADKDTAGNPIRHEYGHCVQGVMEGYLNGRHWESHDGYMHTACMSYWGEIQDTDMNVGGYLTWVNYVPKCVHSSCLQFEYRGFVYADRRPYWYLDFDPDNMGFQPSFCVQMWDTGNKDEYFHTALLRELPVDVNYEDVTLGWSRRWRFFDMYGGEEKRNWYFNSPTLSEELKLAYMHQHTMLLAPCPDKSGWWRSTIGTSPQKMGYSFYELEGAPGQTVTATLRMCDVPGAADGLRWCLAATETGFLEMQTPRYSGFWEPGETKNFTLNADEDYLYLIVAGTPNPIDYDLVAEENAYNLDKHPLKLRYPFEINLSGTQPKIMSLNTYTREIGSGQAHSNGGGFVEDTATVDATAYVGPNARVLGSAEVTGYARIEGHATIIDSKVRDNARVSGRSLVYGSSSDITGSARVRDRAMVRGAADMSGNSLLCDHAKWISGTLIDNAICRGLAWTYGAPTVSGHAILDGDYVREWSPNDGVHKTHIPWDAATYYWDDYSLYLKKPVGLVARYRVEEADGEILQDTWGSMHALIRGTPSTVYDTLMNANVLSLNGSNQHILLDSGIGDSNAFSFSGWCKLTSRVAGATLLHLGHRSDEYIKLVPSNSSDKVELTIRNRSAQQLTLTSSSTIPLDGWAHLAFTTDGSTVRLYVNGDMEDEGTFAFYPFEMITPDLQETAQANYVGRDWSGNYLAANVADLQFYNTAMLSTQPAEMFNQYGRMLGRFYKDSPYTGGTLVNTGIPSTLEGTIMVDVYAEDTGDVAQYRAIVDSWNYVPSHYLQFQYGTGMPSIGVDNGKYVVMLQQYGRWNTNVSCPLSTWQKVALTYTDSQAKLYIDGSPAANVSATQKYPAGAVYSIGDSINTAVDAFVGNLQNIRIFDKAFDDVEILRLVQDLSPTTQLESDPPTPDPATFATAPTAVSPGEITMTATTGSDASPPVQYYFDETSGNPGGSDSGWQISATYNDTGLTAGTQYTYTVKMCDLWGNTGTESAPASATTPTDNDPPTPNPATFATAPMAVSKTEITMTATTGSDYSLPIEYYFDETSGNPGGDDSGWVTNPIYNDTGLTQNVKYTYTVKMRDSLGNTGTASAPFSATPGHVGQWNFDEESGTTAYDSMSSNNATIYGGASLNGSGYLTFDGSDDYAVINRTISNDFTIAFRVKTTDTASTGQWYNGDGLVDGEVGGVTNDFGTALVGSKFGFGVGNPDTTITSTTSINNGDWYHVTATRNATTGLMKVYVNGTPENSTTGPTGSKSSPPTLHFGNLQTNTHYFNGSIDQLDIFNYALSDTEVWDLYTGGGETDPPTPNPATWATVPYAVSSSEISMTATTGSDESPPVEYYFDEITGNPGGSDSGWVTNPIYNDTGLQAGTQYTYRVRMRDSLLNTGNWSTSESATTQQETDPPTPNPATWATVPYAVSSSEISMTATTGSDESPPVEYYFDETTGNPGGSDSGWVTNPVYNDTDLDPNTQYTYTVTMRDSLLNTGTASSPASATTDPALEMYVYDITMSYRKGGTNYYGQATVWIKDTADANVVGATVYGQWTGAVNEPDEGTTGTGGTVMLESSKVKGGGTYNFCVTDVVKSGLTYNSSLNIETCDSITAP